MRQWNLRRAAVLTLVAGGLLSSSACFGSFNMTRKMWAWNKSVSDDKFVQELVFLGVGVVLPIYGLAALMDALVVNSIEFWTGENPVSMAKAVKIDGTDRVERTVSATESERTMVLTAYRGDELLGTTTVRHVLGSSTVTFETRFPDGRTDVHIATRQPDGTAVVMSGTPADLRRAVPAVSAFE